MRRRFFVSQFSGSTATLEGSAAHHLARVLRAEPGQLYELSDGQAVVVARVERVRPNAVEFAVLESVAERRQRLDATLLIAVVKFDRFEWALEKTTELGAGAIVPLAAARSEKALLSASPKRAARWERILLESAQQSRCLRPPQLRPLVPPRQAFLDDRSAVRILMSERDGDPPMRRILEERRDGSDAVAVRMSLAIGPEGGWTEEEFSQAAAAGFAPAALGSNILRTETAVVAGLSAAHLYFD